MEHRNSPSSNNKPKDPDMGAESETAVGESQFNKLRQSIVSRLYELEVQNKRLAREKTSLEHQLLHVLERLGTGEHVSGDGSATAMDREEVRKLISMTIDNLETKLTKPSWDTSANAAPLAEPDYSGFRASLAESAIPSAFEYSSLSDAYEEICLQKDLVQKMITSESSHPSDELQIKQDEAQNKKPVPSSSQMSPQIPVPPKPTIPRMKSSGDLAVFSTSSRIMDRYAFNIDDQFKEELNARMKQRLTGESDLASPLSIGPSAFHKIDAKIKVPQWLTKMDEDSNLDVMKAVMRKTGYDSDSSQSSLGSCSIFSSSSSSASSTHNPVLLQSVQRMNKQTTSSMPSSPVGPTTRTGRSQKLYTPETARSVKDTPHSGLPFKPRRTSSSFHTLTIEQIKPKTREELILTMRKLYGLPTNINTKKESDQMIKHDRVVPAGGPPKVKISRRQIKQPSKVEQYSDTTSTTSQIIQSEIKRPSFDRSVASAVQLKHYLLDPDKSTLLAKSQARPGPSSLHSAQLTRPVEFQKSSMKYYTPIHDAKKLNSSNGQPVRIGSTMDFLNSPLYFGQFFPTDRQFLFEPRDFPILLCLLRPIVGLDAFTRSQGQLTIFQRIQPPFPSSTPIISCHVVPNHSHESSDLTSELSAQAMPVGLLHKKTINVEKVETTDQVVTNAISEVLASQSKSCDPPPPMEGIQAHEGELPSSNGTAGNFEAVLFRLSNGVKIWRRYQAELTSSSLLLHTTEPPHVQPPKRCIPLGEVRIVRKPHNLSNSFTTVLTESAKSEFDGSSKYRIGSVPVTRKFTHGTTEPTSRANYGHFELVLNSGKSHRLKGKDAADTDNWLRRIKRNLRAYRANEILQRYTAQLVMQGWLRRVKGGEMTWVWCRLLGQYLVYSPGPGLIKATGFKSLSATQVRTMYSCWSTNIISQTKIDPTSLTDSNNVHQQLTSSSDSDTLANGDAELQRRTIALWTEQSDPVYLICRTNEEYEQWKDHLCRACEKTVDISLEARLDSDLAETKLRDHWRSLVRVDNVTDPYHTDRLIKVPLSKTTEINQSEVCTQMFRCLLTLSYPQIVLTNLSDPNSEVPFTNVLGTSQWLAIKYAIVNYLSNLCYTSPELKDELFLQLIKQATLSETQQRRLLRRQFPLRSRRSLRTIPWFCGGPRSPRPRTLSGGIAKLNSMPESRNPSGESSHMELITRGNVGLNNFITQLIREAHLVFPVPSSSSANRPEGWWPLFAVWECICLFLPLFLPSLPVLSCLELLITVYCHRGSSVRIGHSDEGIYSELSRYAAFCKEALKQTLLFGGRCEVPSALEVASISIRNPYTHTYPFSLPIHVPNGNVYEVVSFNGGSEFRIVLEQMTLKLSLPPIKQQTACIFGIYLRLTGVAKPTRYIYLKPEWKMCDVLSLYERAIVSSRQDLNVKIPIEDATAEFVFRIQAFSWKRLKRLELFELKPLLTLLVHQLHEDFLSGSYPVIPNGAEMLDLVVLLCRADHFDYTELQNRRETNLSQLIRSYFPTNWVDNIEKDGRSIIQLKLILLDRWSSIGKSFGDFEKSYVNELVNSEDGKQAKAAKTSEEILLCVAKIRACLAYLRLLRSLLPERFATTVFPASAFDLPGHVDTDLVWLVPQENQLNILTVCTEARSSSTRSRMLCTNSISYNSFLSFGGQRDGAFFLVYSDPTGTKKWQKTSRGHEIAHTAGRIERVTGAVYDGRTFHTKRKGPSSSGLPGIDRQLHGKIVRKVRFYLTDLNALMELSDTLVYFMNVASQSL